MNQVIYSLRDAGDEKDCWFISLIMYYSYFPCDETVTHVIKDRLSYWLYILRYSWNVLTETLESLRSGMPEVLHAICFWWILMALVLLWQEAFTVTWTFWMWYWTSSLPLYPACPSPASDRQHPHWHKFPSLSSYDYSEISSCLSVPLSLSFCCSLASCSCLWGHRPIRILLETTIQLAEK